MKTVVNTGHNSEQRMQRERWFQAFTLIELLVTIAVIAALAALLLPVLSKVSESGKSTSCLGNMRIYGNAVLSFVMDNGGSLPRRPAGVPNPPPLTYGKWVTPYLGMAPSEFRCPLATSEDRKLNHGFGYNGNGALATYYPTLKGFPVPLSRIALAAENYDWTQGFWVSGHQNRTIWGNGNGSANPQEEGKARRPQYHGSPSNRGLHFFFLDGHVELVTAPPNNDWDKTTTLGNKNNGGYFYTTGQFATMQNW